MISKLDDLDWKIISIIQQNPNISHSNIAKKVKRSQPTIGMRIKRLKKCGIFQIQPGINLKNLNTYVAIVNILAVDPEAVMAMAQSSPLILNAFRSSGRNNILILLADLNISNLYEFVNQHFRSNPNIQNVSMEIITNIANDFIVPMYSEKLVKDFSFNSEKGNFSPTKQIKKYKKTKV